MTTPTAINLPGRFRLQIVASFHRRADGASGWEEPRADCDGAIFAITRNYRACYAVIIVNTGCFASVSVEV